jgi:hypothetical protein
MSKHLRRVQGNQACNKNVMITLHTTFDMCTFEQDSATVGGDETAAAGPRLCSENDSRQVPQRHRWMHFMNEEPAS